MKDYSFLSKMDIYDLRDLRDFPSPRARHALKRKAKTVGIELTISMGADGKHRAIRTA